MLPMNQPTESPDAHEDSWEVLAGYLEAFLEQWEVDGFGPQLSEHLPSASGPLRRMVLIELIKVDLEYRHNTDGPVLRLEDYLAEYPELGESDGMPVELIQEEYHFPNRAPGESVDVNDCIARFPDQADAIRRRLSPDESRIKSLTGSQLSDAYQPGDHIGDFYLMSALGTGAFGCVFLARQESMQRLVALKVSSDKGTEAQTLAQLDHSNIVRVYDQVRLPEQDLRLLYMQFVPGGTLQAVVKASKAAKQKDGGLVENCIAATLDHAGVLSSQHVSLKNGLAEKPWAEVTCHLGMELAQALHYAHGQGILHRDVKPANVLLEANGSARLADFNISFSSEVHGDNAEASFGGSLAYMSPEQLEACDPNKSTEATDLDARSDVFSLGILLWELMYGTRPFADETVAGKWNETLQGMTEIRHQGVGRPPKTPVNATEELLFSILCRCLEPNPADRYQTASELAQELGLCLQPQVASLIRQSKTGWRRLALAWPLLAFLFAAIVPHIFAAVFNYSYNDKKIVDALMQGQEDQTLAQRQRDAFETLVIFINGIAFSAAFAICIGYSLPVVQAIRRIRQGIAMSPAPARLRSLRLSRFVTILGITEWCIAGLAYPMALYLITGQLKEVVPIYFFGSLFICGLLAAAYPFFLTATLTIQAFVPALLRHDRLTSEDVDRLMALSNQSAWSLYLAGGVPAVGMLILVATGQGLDPPGKLTLYVLCVLGAVGFAFALRLSRSLQRDIEALHGAYRLSDESDQKR
jgi:serine/threonine protein kinase